MMTSIGGKKITHIYQGNELILNNTGETSTFYMGNKRLPFVFQGQDVLYPNPIRKGLVLWYDFSSMTNEDKTKSILQNLVGNKEEAKLKGFAYTKKSGYTNNGIRFDGIDDEIVPIYKHSDGKIKRLNIKEISPNEEFTIEMTLKMSSREIYEGKSEIFTLRSNDKTWLGAFFWKDYTNKSSENFKIKSEILKDRGTEGSIEATSREYGYKYGDNFHICVKLDKTKGMILYVNGIFMGSFSEDSFSKITKPEEIKLYMGYSQRSFIKRFSHRLYTLRVYDRALKPKEIKQHYELEKERFDL